MQIEQVTRKPLNTLRGIETFGPLPGLEDLELRLLRLARKPLNTLRGIETIWCVWEWAALASLENPSTPSGVLKRQRKRGGITQSTSAVSKTPQHPPGY